MATLADEDLFTLPLTFMGVPYGRPGPGNRAAILGLPFDCGVHPFRVGRAADRMRFVCSRR